MKRPFSGWGIEAVTLLVLTALFSVVHVATKALAPQLAKVKARCSSAYAALRRRVTITLAWRRGGLSWFDATYLGRIGFAPIAGGALTEGQHAGEFLLSDNGNAGSPSRENVTVLSGQNLKAGAVVGRVTLGVGRVSIPTVVAVTSGGNGTATAVSAGPEVQVGNYVVTCTVAATNGGTFSVVNPSGKALPNATVGTPYTSREIRFTLNDSSSDFKVGDVFTFVVSTTVPAVVGTGNGVISAVTLGAQAKPGNYKIECIVAATNAATFELFDPDGESLGTEALSGSGGTAVFATPQLNATITDGSTDFAVGDVFNVAVFNQLSGGKAVAWDPTAVDGRQHAAGLLYDNVDASAGDKAGVIVTRDAAVMKGSLQWGAAITAAQKESAYLDLAARGVVAR